MELYSSRVLDALLYLKNTVIMWPTDEEKEVIAAEFQRLTGCPGMVGALDGSLFTLFEKPGRDGGDFYCRHDNFSMSGIAVCDHMRR